MNERKIFFWKRYFIIISYLIIVIGIYIAFFKTTIFFKPFNFFVDPVFWKDETQSINTLKFKYFIYSLLGAVMVLWGTMLYFIIKHEFTSGKKWIWNCIALSVLSWFLIDEFFSILYHVYYNAAFNLGLFFIMYIPLFSIKQYFKK